MPCQSSKKRLNATGDNRLDRLPEPGQRPLLQRAQHLRIAVLVRPLQDHHLAREERAAGDFSARDELRDRSVDPGDADPPPRRDRLRDERSVRPRITRHEARQRVLGDPEQRIRQTALEHDAERIAVARRILDRDEPWLPGDAHANDALRARELVEPRRLGAPRRQLGGREIPEPEKKIVHRIRVLERPVETLELPRVLEHHVRIEELPELRLAEELAELRVVDRERLRPALGGGRVLVVDEVADEGEEQRRRERRRDARIHRRHLRLPRLDRAKDLDEAGQIERLAEALAVRLEDDRKRGKLRGDGEEIGSALSLRPERRSLADRLPREQERARGRLAETGGEERRPGELARDDVLHLLGRRKKELDRRRGFATGNAKDDAVVGPDRLDVPGALLAEALQRGHRPRRVDARSVRREHADPEIAELVGHALDDDRAVRRHRARVLALLADVRDEIVRGAKVEVMLLHQHRHRGARIHLRDPPRQLPDAIAERERPARAVAVPEGHLSRDPRGGGDDDLVARDLLRPPR